MVGIEAGTTRTNLIAEIAAMTPAGLDELCRSYWDPVYAFLRRSGHRPEEAMDLAQGFFARILESKSLGNIDSRRGRFRAWLLGALQHYVANDRRSANTLKRGRGTVAISIDADGAESRCAYELAHELTPERAYDRRWALAVTERVMAQLEQEHALRGKRARFLRLRPFLVGDGAGYRPLAEELGEAEGTLRQRVDRMRRRYRLLLRAEIQRLVARSSDVDAELRHLLAALS